MAKTEAETQRQVQVAMCHKVSAYPKKDKDGNPIKDSEGNPVVMEFCDFHFVDNASVEFTVMASKYFKPEDGKYYTPVVFVYDSAYVGKDGKAYPQKKLGINWEEYK